MVPLAYEARGHPYKENLIKYPGQPVRSLAEQPEIQETIQSMKEYKI
jgi:hypothetical protein